MSSPEIIEMLNIVESDMIAIKRTLYAASQVVYRVESDLPLELDRELDAAYNAMPQRVRDWVDTYVDPEAQQLPDLNAIRVETTTHEERT